MGLPVRILCLVILVVLAGCGASGIDPGTQEPDSPSQRGVTQTTSETTTSTAGPPATETETPPTPTPSPTPESITFAIQDAPNETVAEDQLQTAVRQWQTSGMLSRPANVTDSLITADYRVVFRPTIDTVVR